jgi:hypothetical protein
MRAAHKLLRQWVHAPGVLRHKLRLDLVGNIFARHKFFDIFAKFRARLMGKVRGAEQNIVAEQACDL